MNKLKDAPIHQGTNVFVAADLDVPLSFGAILDTFRLDAMLPTLQYIIDRGGTPIIGGHIGRPDGKVVAELSTQNLVPYFDEKLGKDKYEILENLRFEPAEQKNEFEFARFMAAKADIYVNEVFSTSHRKDASIVGIPSMITGYAGFRLEKEVEILNKLLKNADRPLIVIIGGAKVEDKKPIVSKFFNIADKILLGGKVGLDWNETAPENLILPVDYSGNQMDIGEETARIFSTHIASAKTILWAGPVGRYEDEEYSKGCKTLAEAIIGATQNGAYSVAGGGDTSDMLKNFDMRNKFSFVSTGGGAMLEFLINGTLPGIEAIGGIPSEE